MLPKIRILGSDFPGVYWSLRNEVSLTKHPENDSLSSLQKEASPDERQALADAGGKDGPLAAVESSLHFLASGSDPALEIEDFAVGEQKRIMVLDYDRSRLATFLPPGMRLVSWTVNASGGQEREVRTPVRGVGPPARFGGGWEDGPPGGMGRPPPFMGGPPFMGRPHFGGPPGPVRPPFRPPMQGGPPAIEGGDNVRMLSVVSTDC